MSTVEEQFFTDENEAALARCRHVTINLAGVQVWADSDDEETAIATGLKYERYQPAPVTNPSRWRFSITSAEPLAVLAARRIIDGRSGVRLGRAA